MLRRINATCVSYKHEGWPVPIALIHQDKTTLIKHSQVLHKSQQSRKTICVPYRAGLAEDLAVTKDGRKKKNAKINEKMLVGRWGRCFFRDFVVMLECYPQYMNSVCKHSLQKRSSNQK